MRPERIRIAGPGEPPARNAATGAIETITYKGTTLAIALRLADGVRLQVTLLNAGHSDVSLKQGQALTVSWDDDANVLLEE